VDRCLDVDGSPQSRLSLTGSVYTTIFEPLEMQGDITEQPSKPTTLSRLKMVLRIVLLIWSLFGASCIVADGILTPAVSVISATSGTPDFGIADCWSCGTIRCSYPSDYSALYAHHTGFGLPYFDCLTVVSGPTVRNEIFISGVFTIDSALAHGTLNYWHHQYHPIRPHHLPCI